MRNSSNTLNPVYDTTRSLAHQELLRIKTGELQRKLENYISKTIPRSATIQSNYANLYNVETIRQSPPPPPRIEQYILWYALRFDGEIIRAPLTLGRTLQMVNAPSIPIPKVFAVVDESFLDHKVSAMGRILKMVDATSVSQLSL
ncbi:hypothetical protein HYFRA_00013810 [Hymenoscyphus fraxineus]|uniref:Uncharacterized protein n=1 Tax=Hymenoscyphus fraxineus TaxID=746836 RepID=A0A9N9L8D1_9HELO|nr:hypothetical protein HYFRA_00013810 [Hymenoscyphus fraxineus]